MDADIMGAAMPAAAADAPLFAGPVLPIDVAAGIRGIRMRARNGIPLCGDEIRLLREALAPFPDVLSRIERRAAEIAVGRATSGGRLSRGQYDGLKLLDPASAAEYEAHHRRALGEAGPAMTGAERKANYINRRNEIGALPEISDAARRDRCRTSLADFGLVYCAGLLRRTPSEQMSSFIETMQDAVIKGGRVHVRWPRGVGKTTWIKIAIMWSVAYGWRRFVVIFAQGKTAAQKIMRDVWQLMETSDALCGDFPEICIPIRSLGGVMQRCAAQTCMGVRTEIYNGTELMRLPRIEGAASSGAMMMVRSINAGARGLVNMDQRPDFVFFDDPQTPRSARSRAMTQTLEDFIVSDAMGLSGHDRQMSALMASTPICPDDLSCRFADQSRHPEWVTVTTPMVIRWPADMTLVDDFGDAYRKDIANRDFDYSLSSAYYAKNRDALERGVELIDEGLLDPDRELSAFHHVLNVLFTVGRSAFMSEFQMQAQREEELVPIDAQAVSRRINRVPALTVPGVCRKVVAYCDVNARGDAGLRWTVMAVGPGRVCAVIAYGRFPAEGRLYPLRSTETEIAAAVANGVLAVAKIVTGLSFRMPDGVRIAPAVLCYDGGWQTRVVARAVSLISAPRTRIVWSKGFGHRTYRPWKKGGRGEDAMCVGDHCHLSTGGENGEFIAYQADYWREIMQKSFLAPPLQRGSLSLYGDDPSAHYAFAEEVCAERLAERGVDRYGGDYWRWVKTGENHWGDTLVGCYVLASYYGFYDATDEIVSDVIERETGGRGAGRRERRPAAQRRRARFHVMT